MSLSSITLSGRLRSAPDKRQTPTNIPVTNLLLEVAFMGRGNKPGESRLISQLVKVNAWRDLAEICAGFSAGDKVLVTGRAQINAYTTQDGKRRREVEIDATNVTKLEDVLSLESPPAEDENSEQDSITNSGKNNKDEFATTPDIETLNSQEEIPF